MISIVSSSSNTTTISPAQKKNYCQQLTTNLHKILDTAIYFLNKEEQRTLREAQAFIVENPFYEAPELRRITLAVLKRFFNAEQRLDPKNLENEVEAQHRTLAQKWRKLNYNSEIFFAYPDFVKFVFDAHLHRSMQFYNHTVSLIDDQPHILVHGKLRSWDWIRERISLENGVLQNKKDSRRYTYLQGGLTAWDPTKWEKGIPMKRVPNPDSKWKLEIVSSFIPRQGLLGWILNKSAKHVSFRLINPEGDVYSYGLRRDERDDPSTSEVLANARRVIVSPDVEEMLPRDFLVTTRPIDDLTASIIEAHMKAAAQEKQPFHYFGRNCSALTSEVLKIAGVSVDDREHIVWVVISTLMGFKPLSWIRDAISACAQSISPYAPKPVKEFFRYAVHIIFLPFIATIFTLLGAWKEGKDGTPPYYTSWKDMLDPAKASISLPNRIVDWQRSTMGG